MKRKLVCLLALLVIATGTFVYPHAQQSFADSPPGAPGTGWYVQEYWNESTTWNMGGQTVTTIKAYRKGYSADSGQANAGTSGTPNPAIFLLFGRQVAPKSGGVWNVKLVQQSVVDHTWVRRVAQAFIDGYNDNPSHQVARIAVSVTNGNYNWTCDNNNPSGVSSNWYNAGFQWGSLIGSLYERPKVIIQSGNDIESFVDDFRDENTGQITWRTCGAGTLRWYDGFESAIVRQNYNFGNNPNSEDPAQWTRQDVYNVSWGKSSAFVYPQIYCTGQGWARSWPSIRAVGYMKITGVTAADNEQDRSSCGGNPPPSWEEAWALLDTAMVQAGYENHVGPNAIYFFARGR